MGFKNFGVGCCCKHGYECQPCTCFTFYDPNTGQDTSDSPFGLNVSYSTYLVQQCPSGVGNSQSNVGGPYGNLLDNYQSGSLVCESGNARSPNPFNTPECTGYSLQGCGSVGDIKKCFGDPTESNAELDYLVRVYPPSMTENADNSIDFCAPYTCVCSLDICNSGSTTCLPIPYCPTRINVKWDAFYANLFQQNPQVSFVMGDCPWEKSAAPYYTCGRISSCITDFLQGETSPGQCSFWLQPIYEWSSDLERFIMQSQPSTDFPVYGLTGPDWKIIPGNDSHSNYLVTIDCNSNQINLCQENEIQITYNNKGVGAWSQIQMCSQPCECETTQIPSKYPIDPLQLSISQSKEIDLYNDFGTLYHSETVTFSANVTMDIDKATGPPASFACNADNQCYVNTCKSQQTTVPVSVIGVTLGAGGSRGTAGVGHVELQAVSVGYAGFQPNSVCIQALGEQIRGSQCPSARVTSVVFSPWTCNDLLPQGGNMGARRACFDSNRNFNGWSDEMGSDCCSCDCNCCNNNGQNCTYYYADVNGVLLTGSAYGTVDLCNNVILLTLYDNNLNEIGTISV